MSSEQFKKKMVEMNLMNIILKQKKKMFDQEFQEASTRLESVTKTLKEQDKQIDSLRQ